MTDAQKDTLDPFGLRVTRWSTRMARWTCISVNPHRRDLRRTGSIPNHTRPHQALNMRPPVPETLIRNGPELGG